MRARPSIYNAKPSLAASYWKNRSLVALFVPAVAFYLLFKYLPIFGVQIAFKEFKASLGIMASPWAEPIGKHFLKFFHSYNFERLVTNTFLLSFETLIFSLIPQSIFPKARTMKSSLVRLCGGKSPRSSAMTARICMT